MLKTLGFFIVLIFISITPFMLRVNTPVDLPLYDREKRLIDSGFEYIFPIIIIVSTIFFRRLYLRFDGKAEES